MRRPGRRSVDCSGDRSPTHPISGAGRVLTRSLDGRRVARLGLELALDALEVVVVERRGGSLAREIGVVFFASCRLRERVVRFGDPAVDSLELLLEGAEVLPEVLVRMK